MTRAVRIHEFGGPEVLRLVDVAVGAPSAGQARVMHEAVGLNMVDTYYRSGLYPIELPSGLGGEASGVIEAVGAGVTGFEAVTASRMRAPRPSTLTRRCASSTRSGS